MSLMLAMLGGIMAMPPTVNYQGASYIRWEKCVTDGADAFSEGPDGAEIIARVTMLACHLDEVLVHAEVSTMSAEDWDIEHNRMFETALVEVVRKRALRILEQKK